MGTIEQYLIDNNYNVKPEFTGELVRFDHEGPNTGWFIGWVNGSVKVAMVGDWKVGGSKTISEGAYSEETKKEAKRLAKEGGRKYDEAKKARWVEVAPLYEAEFAGAANGGSHPYIEKKGLSGLFGSRVQGDLLLVPLRDTQGTFWSYQRIFANGDKRFKPDGKIEGCFHVLDNKPITQTSEIFIAEGFATAGSIYMALHCDAIVVCCFTCWNLGPVAEALRTRYPAAKIKVCADNDAYRVKAKTNVRENVGVIAGKEAAAKVSGVCVYPQFSHPNPKRNDFNDLHSAEGLPIVRKQILEPSLEVTDEWYGFFKSVCGGLRKELITDKLFINYNGTWRPALNYEHLLKGLAAREPGCKKQELLERLALHQHQTKDKSLLIDLPEWDGKDHIAEILSFVKCSNYTAAEFTEIFKDWCVNMVGRIYDSTVQNRCLILKGNQGLGKDTLIRSIFSGLGRYLGKFTNSQFQEKDMWEQVATKGIIHIEEFEQTKGISMGFLKNLISADKADFRPPYARDSDSFRCIASFISSANIDDLLRDTTGNRRFVIAVVEKIDWDYNHGNSGQLLAQMFELWRSEWKPSLDLKTLTTAKLEEFEPVNIETLIVEQWDHLMTQNKDFGKPIGQRDGSDIAGMLEPLARQFGTPQTKILTIMKKAGASKRFKAGMRYATSGWWKPGGGGDATPARGVGEFDATH